MSLDVYLYGKEETVECSCSECGHVHTKQDMPLLFNWNITHNLGQMAEAAKLYGALWRPEELNIKTASELIPHLKEGLILLESEPYNFEKLNPSNGWGNYCGLFNFVKAYLEACEEFPNATIGVSR